jgi:hypothetical protein
VGSVVPLSDPSSPSSVVEAEVLVEGAAVVGSVGPRRANPFEQAAV